MGRRSVEERRRRRLARTGLPLLIDDELAARLPRHYETEHLGDDRVVHAKFFTPSSSWTWYVVEHDPEVLTCFGIVVGFEREWGYFSVEELEAQRMPVHVERDEHWRPITVGELLKRLDGGEHV